MVTIQQQDLMALLKLQLPSMTRVLKKIGECVRDNPEQVIYSSINELADEAGTSVASVMRFCKELNFDSFASFKLVLAHELALQTTHGLDRAENESTKDQLCEQVCDVLRMTSRLIKLSDIDEVARGPGQCTPGVAVRCRCILYTGQFHELQTDSARYNQQHNYR